MAPISLTSPAGHPPIARQSAKPAPATLWIAPSLSPPPSRDAFAASAIASTFNFVISPEERLIPPRGLEHDICQIFNECAGVAGN